MKIRFKDIFIKLLFLLFLAGMIINMAGEDIELDHCTAKTTGTVVSVSSGTVNKNGKTYVHYNARVAPDEEGLFDSSTLVSRNTMHKYAEGDKVKIWYDPEDTFTYYIQYAEPKKNGIAIAGIIAIILIPMALSVVCKLKRYGLLPTRKDL